ncbi:MAG: DUF2794 domain-containing protein [Rhizobiaceae bacterium]|nr:DUF2794 domain-containing protein [Rhizobiaceae bacterium]
MALDAALAARETRVVTFHRTELDAILRSYSLMVGAGEWRDYALDHLSDRAVFSVFKRASEMPVFRVEKHPDLARKQGAFLVRGADGRILKRGHEVAAVLTVFEKELKLANARKGRF